jgi:hypothetical protein
MFQPSVPGNFSTHEAEVFSGQAVCDQLNISQIDFLKIDVEGAEHLVLKGFGDMLSTNQIKIIQFEYGECNKITRFLLGDFYDLLCKRGYIVGKIFPYGVEFKDYKIRDDDFIGPNYLAVLESEKKIIEKLRNF